MLTHRTLTQAEAALLHEELKTTPNILGYTVKELTRFPDVFVAEVEGAFAGACISKDLWFGWTDIAVLYVLPAFRGQGLGTELYTAAWQRAQQRSRHIFTLSCSPEVIHLMERFGMRVTRSMWSAPLAVHLHMNKHMMHWYRLKEAFRKSRQMQRKSPLLSGTKR
jgi:ribosomal protein S18 acetylase RimI-like enzyme